MTVVKCDRCGVIADSKEVCSSWGKVTVTSRVFPLNGTPIDLCGECVKRVESALFTYDTQKSLLREFWIVDYEDGINLLAQRSKPTSETIGSNKLIKVREVNQ